MVAVSLGYSTYRSFTRALFYGSYRSNRVKSELAGIFSLLSDQIDEMN